MNSVNVQLISYTPNPVDVIEEAASTCYDSSPTGGRIMNHCYNHLPPDPIFSLNRIHKPTKLIR